MEKDSLSQWPALPHPLRASFQGTPLHKALPHQPSARRNQRLGPGPPSRISSPDKAPRRCASPTRLTPLPEVTTSRRAPASGRLSLPCDLLTHEKKEGGGKQTSDAPACHCEHLTSLPPYSYLPHREVRRMRIADRAPTSLKGHVLLPSNTHTDPCQSGALRMRMDPSLPFRRLEPASFCQRGP